MSEFAIGKLTRQGTVGSFATLMGKRFAWMGSFVGFVAIAIMFLLLGGRGLVHPLLLPSRQR